MAEIKPHKRDRRWSAVEFIIQKVVSQFVWVLSRRGDPGEVVTVPASTPPPAVVNCPAKEVSSVYTGT
jgi:hypothetical protein